MSASLLTLAWKSLANRGVSVALTILSIVLAVMLFLGVEKIRTGVRASFDSTISDTDLIVGARGGDLLCYGSREEGGGGRGGGAVRVPLGGAREDLGGQVRSAVGEAVLYRGDELHRWEPLDRDASSRRVLLVVWFRSSSWRADYRFCDDQQPVRDSSYMYF